MSDVIVDGQKLHGSTIEPANCIACTQLVDWGYVPTTKCYVFEADCRGDGIALCSKHLAMVLEQLKKEEMILDKEG